MQELLASVMKNLEANRPARPVLTEEDKAERDQLERKERQAGAMDILPSGSALTPPIPNTSRNAFKSLSGRTIAPSDMSSLLEDRSERMRAKIDSLANESDDIVFDSELALALTECRLPTATAQLHRSTADYQKKPSRPVKKTQSLLGTETDTSTMGYIRRNQRLNQVLSTNDQDTTFFAALDFADAIRPLIHSEIRPSPENAKKIRRLEQEVRQAGQWFRCVPMVRDRDVAPPPEQIRAHMQHLALEILATVKQRGRAVAIATVNAGLSDHAIALEMIREKKDQCRIRLFDTGGYFGPVYATQRGYHQALPDSGKVDLLDRPSKNMITGPDGTKVRTLKNFGMIEGVARLVPTGNGSGTLNMETLGWLLFSRQTRTFQFEPRGLAVDVFSADSIMGQLSQPDQDKLRDPQEWIHVLNSLARIEPLNIKPNQRPHALQRELNCEHKTLLAYASHALPEHLYSVVRRAVLAHNYGIAQNPLSIPATIEDLDRADAKRSRRDMATALAAKIERHDLRFAQEREIRRTQGSRWSRLKRAVKFFAKLPRLLHQR